VGNPTPKGGIRGRHSVNVDEIKVAGESGKIYDVGFGDGPGPGPDLQTGLKFLKIHPTDGSGSSHSISPRKQGYSISAIK
jgi:hypothetical protein